MARALEGVGAAVETERAGEIFFAVGGLRGLYGGDVAGVVAVAEGVLGTVRGAGSIGVSYPGFAAELERLAVR